jgi:hypothetical protein
VSLCTLDLDVRNSWISAGITDLVESVVLPVELQTYQVAQAQPQVRQRHRKNRKQRKQKKQRKNRKR